MVRQAHHDKLSPRAGRGASTEQSELFLSFRALLQKHQKGLVPKIGYLTVQRSTASKATKAKPSYHLYGKKSVSLFGRNPQPTYVAGIIQQKHFVGFYSMPIYSHPKEFSFSPELAKMVKGKSCINVTKLTPALEKELEAALLKGIRLYRKLGWV